MDINKYLIREEEEITPEQLAAFKKSRDKTNTHFKAYDSIAPGIEKIMNQYKTTVAVGTKMDKKFVLTLKGKIKSFIFGIKGLDFSKETKMYHVDTWTNYLTDTMAGKDPLDRARQKYKDSKK